MLCERCKKNEASIVVTEVVNGVRTEHHLCSRCAAESGWGTFLDSDFGLGRMLSGLFGFPTGSSGESSDGEDEYEQIVCPTCGTSYRDFLENSRFGCAECYRTFGILMGSTVKKLQGSQTHTGKRPKRLMLPESQVNAAQEIIQEPEKENYEDKLLILQSRLKEALEEEEYEAAAKYRDQIRALKEEHENGEMV